MQTPSLAYAQEQIDRFMKSLSEVTRRNYEGHIPKVVKEDLASFVFKSMQDPEYGENKIIDWIAEARNGHSLANQSIRTYVAGARSSLLFAGVRINDKKIAKCLPKKNKPQDKIPSIDEIRRLYDILDLRGKFIVALFVSSGIRVGAFDYFTLKDLEEYDGGIGKLTVYRGEPEEYETFVSGECMNVFKQYKELREKSGEKLTRDSPLLRTVFEIFPTSSSSSGRKKGQHRDYGLRRAGTTAIQQFFDDYWHRAGIDSRDFKQCHGFRKYFKTTLERTMMKTSYVERLLGHAVDSKLEGAYNKPTLEVLADMYRAYQSLLYISQVPALEEEVKRKEAESGKVSALEMQVQTLAQQALMYQNLLVERERERQEERKELTQKIDEAIRARLAELTAKK